MTETFKIEIEKVLEREGGYVNDPHDRGGETNYGISQRAYPNINIKALTKTEAQQIYWTDYWLGSKVDQLPEHLQGIYFDMCINHGKRRATKILQESANYKNKHQIVVDGLIGKNTLKAIRHIDLDIVSAMRVLFYAELVLRKESQKKFWLGWFKRGVEFMIK